MDSILSVILDVLSLLMGICKFQDLWLYRWGMEKEWELLFMQPLK